jgi:hypothetical protein
MEPTLGLDDARRTLDGTSAAGFTTHPGGYPVSSEPEQAGHLIETTSSPGRLQSFMLSAAAPIPLYSARATRLFSLTWVDDDTSTPDTVQESQDSWWTLAARS